MSKPKRVRVLEPKDVVRLPCGRTGILNRLDGDMWNVFRKDCEFGIWYFTADLKRIGRQ